MYNADKRYVCARPSRRTVTLSGFRGVDPEQKRAALPSDYADFAVGFGFKDGCLVSGPGARYLKGVKPDLTETETPNVPKPAENCRLGIYRTDDKEENYNKIMLMYTNGAAALPTGDFSAWQQYNYFLMSNFNEGINVLDPDGKPVFVLVSTGGEAMCIYTGSTFDVIGSATATVTTICKHSERVFAVMSDDECTVLYSDAFDVYNWDVSLDAGGYITFDRDLGRIRKLVSFADYLYVFCDYGIYRVSTRGDQLSFSVKRLYTACSRIYPETIAEAGDRIIFCAGDGVYSFDGYDVTRISTRLNKYFHVGADGMCAAYCKHKYYLAFRLCEDGWTAGDNNSLAILDLDTGELCISRGFYIFDMETLATGAQNTVIATAKNVEKLMELSPELGSYLGQALEKEWRIGGVDMGDAGAVKVICSAEVNTQTPFTLTFTNERGKTRSVSFAAGRSTRRIGICGKTFSVAITTQEEDVLIRPISLTVDFYEGGEHAV